MGGSKDVEWGVWYKESKKWHLDMRCGPETRKMLLSIDRIVMNKPKVSSRWDLKNYINYGLKGNFWLRVETGPTQLMLDFFVRPGIFKRPDVAKHLGIMEYDADLPQREKIRLPTSVQFLKYLDMKEVFEQIRLRLKKDYDPENKKFVAFIDDAYAAAKSTEYYEVSVLVRQIKNRGYVINYRCRCGARLVIDKNVWGELDRYCPYCHRQYDPDMLFKSLKEIPGYDQGDYEPDLHRGENKKTYVDEEREKWAVDIVTALINTPTEWVRDKKGIIRRK